MVHSSTLWRRANPEKAREQRQRHAKSDKGIASRRARALKNKDRNNEYTRVWKKSNPEATALTERRSNLKRKYGITLEQYDEMLESQGYRCAVCLKHKDDERLPLAVDHNHNTNEVRGLLCNDCNRNLIAQRDDPEIFLRAAAYIGKREKLV